MFDSFKFCVFPSNYIGIAVYRKMYFNLRRRWSYLYYSDTFIQKLLNFDFRET